MAALQLVIWAASAALPHVSSFVAVFVKFMYESETFVLVVNVAPRCEMF